VPEKLSRAARGAPAGGVNPVRPSESVKSALFC
jgi:hypothetical protein